MISGDLEYLIASLPDLSFQDRHKIRERVFMLFKQYAGVIKEEDSLINIFDQEAEKFLSPKASFLLRGVDLNIVYKKKFQRSTSSVLCAFSKFIFAQKEEIKQLRLARKGIKHKLPRNRPAIVLSQATPLADELQIMKYQWDKLEELSVGHHANLEALVAYKLKLMILLRCWSFDHKKGFDTFTQLTTTN